MAEEDSITQGLTGLLGSFTGGVLVAGVLAIALKKLGDKLGEGMYGLLTTLPRRALERITLRVTEDKRITHYRAKIPDEYGRHVLTKQRQVTVDSVYIHLQYERAGRRHDLRRRVLEEKAVLLLGEAGAGKSLLSKYFLLRWAELPRKLQREQQLPVLVELHRCDGTVDLASLIAARFRLPHDKDDSRARDFVIRRLNEGSLRLIFDGLDEVNPEHQPAVIEALEIFRRSYASGEDANSIVVTCRSSAYNGSLGAFELIHIADFDDSSILRFLDRWLTLERSARGGLTEAELSELGTAEALFEQIRQNPQLHQLARTPLLLSLLADLYTGSLLRRGRSLPSSRAAFYSRVTDHMVTRDLLLHRPGRSSPYEPGEKLAVLKRIALTMTETAATEGDRLIIAAQRLREVMTGALTSLDLRTEYGRELLRDLTDRSQLLIGSDTGERFWFPHRSFQEYFTARALEGPAGAGRLLAGYWADPAFWRDTVRFWCGLDGNDSTFAVERLFASEEITHRILALECLAEASQIDGELADRILAHFLTELPTLSLDLGLDGIVDALGSVAARDTERGRALRARLEAESTSGVQPAMRALARSGRPDAARFLVELAVRSESPQASGCAKAMGEVAVPALAGAVVAHRFWAVDALGSIATPSAALALAGLLWSNADTAARAAWWLCALIREPNIEAALNQHAPWGPGADEDGIDLHGRYPVAWHPFTTESNGRLARTMQRAAYLADKSAPPGELPKLDRRVALLLASLTIARIPAYTDASGVRGPETEEDVRGFLTQRGIPLERHGIFDALPLQEQLTLVLLSDDRFFSHVDESNWEYLWSRASQDTAHNTRFVERFYRTALGLVLVGVPGVGIYRAVSTTQHAWGWGPTWLAWAMLILCGCALISIAVGGVLSELSWRRRPLSRADELRRGTDPGGLNELEVLFSSAGADLLLMAGGLLAVPGTLTLVAWSGWIPVLVTTTVLLLVFGTLYYITQRMEEENRNPFRAIIHAYHSGAAARV